MRVGLFDSMFPDLKTVSLIGDNLDEVSYNIEWARDEVLSTTFFTDRNLEDVKKASDRVIRVAWLTEPPDMTDTFFYKAFRMESEFDYILTFSIEWIAKAKSPKWLYYPMGGSGIRKIEWGIGEKPKSVSIYLEHMRYDSQGLTHEIAKKAEMLDIAVHHSEYNRYKDALQEYRYSIVIEKIREMGYFTHRLVDCLSQGTIPIYWGDPAIGSNFDPAGIIPFNNVDDLVNLIVNNLSEEHYMKSIPAIMRNLDACEKFYCAEDWIFQQYPFLFEGKT